MEVLAVLEIDQICYARVLHEGYLSKKTLIPINQQMIPILSANTLIRIKITPYSFGPGPLVLWSLGPLVPWSSGPLVVWSLGPLVLVFGSLGL